MASARAAKPASRKVIDILRRELDTTMVLAGIDDVKKIDRSDRERLAGEFSEFVKRGTRNL